MKTTFLFLILLILSISAFGQNASRIADFEKQPKIAWKFKTTGPVISTPVVDEKMVYFGSLDSGLYALDKNNGTVRWTFGTYGKIRSTVCLDGEKLYLLSGDGNLYCINKNSGQEIWRFRTATGY
ncbi:MAG: PQQ-like beta-propeller repeat protein, partial [Desulfobulbaceae bacterium]